MKCEVCGAPERLSPVVYLLVVFAPGLPDGVYHIVPAEAYRVCDHDDCDSVARFVRRALESHPVTRAVAGNWTHVQIDWVTPGVKPWVVKYRGERVGLA